MMQELGHIVEAIVFGLGKLALEDPERFLIIQRDYADHLRLLANEELTYQGKMDLQIALNQA